MLPEAWYEEMPILTDLIVRCWDANPFKRPTFSQIGAILDGWEGTVGAMRAASLSSTMNKLKFRTAGYGVRYTDDELSFAAEGRQYMSTGVNGKPKPAAKPSLVRLDGDSDEDGDEDGEKYKRPDYIITNMLENSSKGSTGDGVELISVHRVAFPAASVLEYSYDWASVFRQKIVSNYGADVTGGREVFYIESEHSQIISVSLTTTTTNNLVGNLI